MKGLLPYTINVRGQLLNLSKPQVMGILNVTPDSFYAGSRMETEDAIRKRVRQIADEGGEMIDVGAYSSRPGAADVSSKEEMERLRRGMKIVREECPDLPVSVDTFRADVAKMCVEELGVDIINDISGGGLDKAMFPTVAKLGVPYILMHMKGTPQTMQEAPHYDDLLKEVMLYFSERIQRLRDLGQKDIILPFVKLNARPTLEGMRTGTATGTITGIAKTRECVTFEGATAPSTYTAASVEEGPMMFVPDGSGVMVASGSGMTYVNPTDASQSSATLGS
jgi:hypothetical protein